MFPSVARKSRKMLNVYMRATTLAPVVFLTGSRPQLESPLKRYRTTTIKVRILNSERAWLTPSDFEEWADQVFKSSEYRTLEQGKIPGGIRVTARPDDAGLVDNVTFHLTMPRKNVNRELQEALFSLERLVPISIAVTEGDLSLSEVEALEIGVDPAYIEVFQSDD